MPGTNQCQKADAYVLRVFTLEVFAKSSTGNPASGVSGHLVIGVELFNAEWKPLTLLFAFWWE